MSEVNDKTRELQLLEDLFEVNNEFPVPESIMIKKVTPKICVSVGCLHYMEQEITVIFLLWFQSFSLTL